MTTNDLPNYHPMIAGEWRLTLPIVCDDGQIRTVRIEEYTDGFHAFLTKDDGEYTKRIGYKTSKKAINAAAKW